MATGNSAYYMVTAYCDTIGYTSTVGHADRAIALVGVERAYRRFLSGQHPSSLGAAHPWSFLRPMGQIQIPVFITGTGTGAYLAGSTTIVDDDAATQDLFTDATHPSGEVGVGILVDGQGLMRITAVSNADTVVALGGVANFTSKTFYTGAQIDMPADFGGLVTNFFYPYDSANGTGPLLKEISAERMMERLQGAPTTGTPEEFALIPMAFTAATGQRYSVIFWPLASADRVVQYRYRQVPAALTDDNAVYLAGGIDHTNTIEMAVRADAEFQSRNKAGTYEDAFLTAMMGSISRDGTMFFTEGMPRIAEG